MSEFICHSFRLILPYILYTHFYYTDMQYFILSTGLDKSKVNKRSAIIGIILDWEGQRNKKF